MNRGRRLLVKGGQIVSGQGIITADVLVEGERISALLSPGTDAESDSVIDAGDAYVLPGVIDAHTHIKLDTGIYATVDDWAVGTRSAALGGVTTVLDFANQIVGRPFEDALAARRAEAEGACIDYAFHMVVLDPLQDTAALRRDLHELLEMGVTSIKLFTTYRPNYYLDDAAILRVFRAMPEGMLAMVHCENDSIVTDATQRLVAQGRTGWQYHAQARPDEAEAEAVHRILYLAQRASARVYIVHNSTPMATRAVNQMRDQRSGWTRVYCETCPQYVLLHDGVYEGEHPEHFILQPPLRNAAHMEELRRLVEAGMIDVLATDSCDYSLDQKNADPNFTKTLGGLPGIETLLPLMFTTFSQRVGMQRLVQMLAENPAKLFGLFPRKGVILPGSDADIVIYDPQGEGTVRATDMHYRAGYSPFDGMPVRGRVRSVLSLGDVIVNEGFFLGAAGRGQFLAGGPSIDL